MAWEECDSIEPELQQVTPLTSDPEIGRLETVMFRGNVQKVNLERESRAWLIRLNFKVLRRVPTKPPRLVYDIFKPCIGNVNFALYANQEFI